MAPCPPGPGPWLASQPWTCPMRSVSRAQDELGSGWQLFLVLDKDEKPTAVVLPSSAQEGVLSRFTELWLTGAFGLGTLLTSINSAGAPVLQFLVDPLHTPLSQQVGFALSCGAARSAPPGAPPGPQHPLPGSCAGT